MKREINATLVSCPQYALDSQNMPVPAREAHIELREVPPLSFDAVRPWTVRYDCISLVLDDPVSMQLIDEKPLTRVMTHIPEPRVYESPQALVRGICTGTAGFVPANSLDEEVYFGLLGRMFSEINSVRGMNATLYRQSCIKIDPVRKRIHVVGTDTRAVLLPGDLLKHTLPAHATTERFLLEHIVL